MLSGIFSLQIPGNTWYKFSKHARISSLVPTSAKGGEMPFKQTEETRATQPCKYGTCPYFEYDMGKGYRSAVAAQSDLGKPPCGHCGVKPEDSPAEANPHQWRKI
jgi:hypothetical protein